MGSVLLCGWMFFQAAAADKAFQKDVEPLFTKYCVHCHGPEKQKGRVRLDGLSAEMDTPLWRKAYSQLKEGEMPPEKEAQPLPRERELMAGWLGAALKKAGAVRNGVIFRRLNRREYNNTLNALFGIELDIEEMLPPERVSADGFLNNGGELVMSPLHFEYYLKIARHYVDKAIVTGERPGRTGFQAGFTGNARLVGRYLDGRAGKPDASSTVRKRLGDGTKYRPRSVVLPPAIRAKGVQIEARQGAKPMLEIRLKQFPDVGAFRIRVKASSLGKKNGHHPWLGVMFGNHLDDGIELEQIGSLEEVTASSSRPGTFEFHGRMENLPLPFRQKNLGLQGDLNQASICIKNAFEPDENGSGPLLEIHSVEFEAPFIEQWPPKSHRSIFINSRNRENEPAYAREIFTHFLRQAYRRPPEEREVKGMMALWKSERAAAGKEAFEKSIRDVLPAALVAPAFLYLVEPSAASESRKLNNHELASRLSYFLWSAMPDAALNQLADRGKLDEFVLPAQARRLLADARSRQFVENFTSQWLDLGALERVAVDRKQHPTYQPYLREAMRAETYGFFAEILHDDLSALNLIDSSFVYINPLLARHYGIQKVRGAQFRRVEVRPEDHRGGLLTQGSFLTGHSSGLDSHPIKRGNWLLSRLLNDPLPPPPPNVPELNRGNPAVAPLSVREQLKQHSDREDCRRCHEKMDPFGISLENYNAVGQWRDARGGRKVDSEATLSDGTRLDGVVGLKQFLLQKRRDQFARALVSKLLAYALGRSLTIDDEPIVRQLVEVFGKNGYRIKPLIEAIVVSEPFRTK